MAVSAIALLATLVPALLVANIALHIGQTPLPYVEKLATPWIQTSTFTADFGFALDQLTLVMLCVVTGVGFVIHVYSIGYMAEEEGYWRFFAYLNLFMFFMSVLVLAENFLLMFVGWEGVGLASYLLIGFYFTRQSASNAGMKAFIVNRIGDFGFLLAMFLLIAHFGSLSFSNDLRSGGGTSGMAGRISDNDCAAASAGRNWQVGADSAVRVAAGCDGRSDAGVGVDPRGNDGDRGHLHGGAHARDL